MLLYTAKGVCEGTEISSSARLPFGMEKDRILIARNRQKSRESRGGGIALKWKEQLPIGHP